MKLAKKIVDVAIAVSFFAPSFTGFASENNWRGQIPAHTEVKVDRQAAGNTLLFSDSPEMVKNCGVLYRDTVEGKVRLFFHHVNDTKSIQQLAVVLRNKNPFRQAHVTLGRKGISRPDKDWLRAGKDAQIKFLKEATPVTFKLRGKKEILSGTTGVKFMPQDLISGIMDFTFSKPVTVSVMMLPVNTDFYDAVDVYDVLPADEGDHVLRGTFPFDRLNITVKDVYNTDSNVIWGMKLADRNYYVKGIDATTGKKVTNYGNYGVVYDLRFRTTGRNDTQVRFNPYGGEYAGACEFNDGVETNLVPLPRHAKFFGEKTVNDTVIIGKVKGGKTGRVIFSPPGSSNLPIRIFLESVEKENK